MNDCSGIEVSGISLPSKKVTLKGMNNLKNGVKINSFDLPANDPAGGIHLTLDTTVTNVRYSINTFEGPKGFTHKGFLAIASWNRIELARIPKFLWKYQYWPGQIQWDLHPQRPVYRSAQSDRETHPSGFRLRVA